MSPPAKTTRAESKQVEGQSKTLSFLRELNTLDSKVPLSALLILAYLYKWRNHSLETNLRTLRKELGLSSTNLTRGLYHWSEEFLSIRIDPGDRRGRLVSLTPEGERYYARLEALIP